MRRLRRVAPTTWSAEFLVGGLTGLIFQLVVYPFDLIKARLMTQDGVRATQVARGVWSADGLAGFYRGASVACLRAFAINAAGWPALRAAQWWLGVTTSSTTFLNFYHASHAKSILTPRYRAASAASSHRGRP